MIKYPEYKDSGIEWLEYIPKQWEVIRLKYLVSDRLKYGANESADEENPEHPRYIRITDFNGEGKLRDETFKSLPLEVAKEYLLEEGDVLFARSGATVGKTFIFKDYDGNACFAGYLIKATPDHKLLNSKFLYNVTLSNYYQNWKNSIFIQATIQNIGADKYQNLLIPVPPIVEQTAIANFLDHKTQQIDDLIAKKRRLIELLKEERTAVINQAVTKGLDPNVPMKDSGIEWLGEIPEHWEFIKLKYLAKIRYGLGQPPRTKDDGLPIIRATNIQKGEITEDDLMYVDPDDLPYEKNPILKEEEIIVVRSGAYTADSAIIPSKYAGCVAGYDLVLTCQSINPYLLSFILLSPYVLNNQLIPLSSRAAQPHLNAEELGSTVICVPLKAEQEEIVRYLISEKHRINSIIDNCRKEITLLDEYKTSLINEAVTGKINVINAT